MNKIKENYDKVILIALLLLFIVILVVVAGFIKASEKPVTDKDEQALKEMIANYENTDSIKVAGADAFLKGVTWSKPKITRFATTRSYTDLAAPYAITRCKKCSSLISYDEDFIRQHKCSNCGVDLKEIKYDDTLTRDTDNDGIPDIVWTRLGRPVSPGSADVDSDGWTNLEEYNLAKIETPNDFSALIDPKKHPSLTAYLAVDSVQQEVLPINLQTIINPTDSARARFVVVVSSKPIPRQSARVGGEFTVGNDKYKILKGRKEETKSGTRYYMTLECQTTKIQFDVESGVAPFHPQKQAHLSYGGELLPSIYNVGDDVTVGNETLGIEKWKVLQITEGKVVLQNAGGKKETITDVPLKTLVTPATNPQNSKPGSGGEYIPEFDTF